MAFEKYSINYTGGAHGHFLDHACNYIFFKQVSDPDQYVTINGTYHNDDPKLDRQFKNFPFWWVMPGAWLVPTLELPKIPYVLEKTVINISSKSLEEMTLLRMYWRRRGDGFCSSPNELLNTTKQQLTDKINSVKYLKRWPAVEAMAQFMRDLLTRNALNLYKTDTYMLTEMDVIRFWINPIHPHRYTDYDTLIYKSIEFIEYIKPTHNVIEFEMKWFYNPEEFLSGIKMLGRKLELEQQVPDQEIIDMVKKLPDNIHEFPTHLALVREQFEAIKQYKSVDLTMLELNDKIALLNMINIEFKLWSGDYQHLIEFPDTSDQLVEIIKNKVKTVR